MIKLKSLLLEKPDELKFDGNFYDYTDNNVVGVFIIVNNKPTAKQEFFGYNAINNTFISSISHVLDDIENKLIDKPKDYYDIDIVNEIHNFIDSRDQRTHDSLKKILRAFTRFSDLLEGRIFDINRNISVMGLWQENYLVKPYKNILNQVAANLHRDPKKMIYEPFSPEETKYSYDELYDKDIPKPKSNSEIQREITKKEKEYQILMSNLHVKAAILSTEEKNKIKNNAILIKAELDLLKSALSQGKSELKDVEFKNALLNAVHSNPKNVKSLLANLETQFGMTLAQIRHKYNDIPFLKTIKSTIDEYRLSRKAFLNQ